MNLRLNTSLLALSLLPVIGCATAVSDQPDSADSTAGPSTLYAALIMTKEQQASSTPTDSGVLLRDPQTGAWERFGPKIMMISGVVSDPNNPQRVFFACGNGIARTTDGGDSWRLVTGWRESDVQQIVIDPTNSDNVYAATAWGVTVSRDGGDTWTAANEGLPEYYSKGIALDKRDPDRLLLATTTGLFESTNQARSWKRVESFPEVAALRLRRGESDPDTWIAGTEGKGVWISLDDVGTWQPTAPSLADANIYGVAVDPTDSSRLAAGGWGTGVQLSMDGGITWKPATGALPSPNITVMSFDVNSPHRLWVSTFEEGTFYSDDAGSSWTTADLDGAYVFDLGFLPPVYDTSTR